VSGTYSYTMTSAGLAREYIVSVPTAYDQNKPYRLVFAMHMMGGSDSGVSSDGYYKLQPLDTASTTIFVAPEGYTDGSPWRTGSNDDKDHIFFDDMVSVLKSSLCIDSSRIFVVGFSFGAMFANSLAQNHQQTLRGTVVYATYLHNIYIPANTGAPMGWFGTVGLSDTTCPPDEGRAARDRFIQNNGCAVPGSGVPEAVSGGSHVCYTYQCDGKHPVTWCTFDGGHSCTPVDPGQSTTWIPAASWSFITQF
jgi:poly(3-hydroxybutyrate) depolymerase